MTARFSSQREQKSNQILQFRRIQLGRPAMPVARISVRQYHRAARLREFAGGEGRNEEDRANNQTTKHIGIPSGPILHDLVEVDRFGADPYT